MQFLFIIGVIFTFLNKNVFAKNLFMKDDKMNDMIQRFQTAGIIPTEQEIKKAQDK
jgi:cell fate (sporulation/competence/biofilm development) regulator YlbF (YheA/YmcA/DUF963 family)